MHCSRSATETTAASVVPSGRFAYLVGEVGHAPIVGWRERFGVNRRQRANARSPIYASRLPICRSPVRPITG